MASFLGLCNYYRRLIPLFAEDAEPLYKEVPQLKVRVSELLQTAFAKLNEHIRNGVGLRFSYADKPFVLETNASIHAVGEIL